MIKETKLALSHARVALYAIYFDEIRPSNRVVQILAILYPQTSLYLKND
jgi:hypothetical protein